MISFARSEQIKLAAEVCQTFCLDNGAYSAWRRGASIDLCDYYSWVDTWMRHPGFDFALIPDKIDGRERDNDVLLEEWPFNRWQGCPVWHLHESLARLRRLARDWPRVALGSSGVYERPNSAQWWSRMHAAMKVCCDGEGRPRTRLHGLRMLNPSLFGRLPLASADSTNVARNVQLDQRWLGPYAPSSKRVRGLVLVDRIEAQNSSAIWAPKAA